MTELTGEIGNHASIGTRLKSVFRRSSRQETVGTNTPWSSRTMDRRTFFKRAGVTVAGAAVTGTAIGKLIDRTENAISRPLDGNIEFEGKYNAQINSFIEDGKTYEPVVRTEHQKDELDKNVVSPQDYAKLKIDIRDDVIGEYVLGGAYNGKRGNVTEDKHGKPYGEWFKIKGIDQDGKSKDYYIASNFVFNKGKVVDSVNQ